MASPLLCSQHLGAQMQHQRQWILLFLSCSLAAGCSKGTQPADMSRGGHEAAGAEEQRMAREHESQAAAAQRSEGPKPEPGSVVAMGQDGCVEAQTVCWTSMANPTAEHRQQAERHRELAARHRAASQALSATEQRACSGLSEADRDMSPFRHTEDITSVTQAERDVVHGRVSQSHVTGATIVFRAVPGMTQQWLQRVVDCHRARGAVIEQDPQYMPYCPLMVRGAKAEVRSVAAGFAVDVIAEDATAAQEIIARAQRLRSPGT